MNQWRGLNYRANRADADLESQHGLIVGLRERLKDSEKRLEEQAAKIVELAGKLDELATKHETLCESLRPVWPEIKKLAGKNGKT